jgi:TPR repeat protein
MNTESPLVLPAVSSGLPTLEREESWTIDKFDGDATLELRLRWRALGALSARGGWGRASESERKDTLLAEFEKNYPGVRLLGEPKMENLEDGAVFSVTARFTVPAPVTLRDGIYELPYHSGILDGTIGLPDKLSRSFPFALAGGKFHGRYLAHVQWPRHARMAAPSVARHLDNAFFVAHSEGVQQGNRLEFVFDYRLKRAEIGKDEVVSLQREAKSMFELTEGGFRFERNLASDPGLDAASYRELETMSMMASLAEQGKLLKLTAWDEKQTQTACGSAILLLNADELPHARDLSDALTARLVKMTDSAKAQACAAGLAFAGGDPERASQLLRGRELGDSQQAPYQAEFLLAIGQAEQARKRLLGEFDKLRAGGTLSQLQAVKILALLQRAGGAPPTELVDYIAPDVDQTWPRPIASMLLDRLQEDDLIRLAEQGDGDLRTARLTEAWYYVGQHRLARKDVPGAIAAFRWHRAKGLRTLSETMFALAELRRLIENDADYRTGFKLAMANKFEAAYPHYLAAAQRGTLEAEYRLGLFYADTRHDYPNARDWLNKAFAHGSESAANHLAVMYDEGTGVAVDKKRAGELFEQAARMGSKHGAFNLADRLEAGVDGFQPDLARAFLLYRDAAFLGHEDAMGKVAELYGSGEGVAQDYRMSRFWAVLGMVNGSMKAQAYLAFLYKWGHGVPKDQAMAAQLYREAAENDVPAAQVQLGNSYEYGLGVEQNAAEAAKWYGKASRHGNTYAQAHLAMLTLKGKPSAGEAEKAVRTLQQLLDNGDLERAVDLATVYKTGIGGSPDIPRAIGYYKTAAEQGNLFAQTALANLYYLGPPTQRDCAAALIWYEKAVAGNDDLAMNNLGDMYENGCGVPADMKRAIVLYARAATMGNPVAFASLGSLYERGLGIKQVPLQAYLYYRIAIRLGYAKANARAERLRDSMAKDQLAEADAQAAAWKKGDPLPGLLPDGAPVPP